jgi:hypothetical protein
LVGVTADIDEAFGGGVNPALSTPQGQLASSEAAVVGNSNDNFVFMTNMFDPALSFGRYQDALARIYFIERNPSVPTVLQVACVGLVGVTIPENSLIQDEAGNTYTCTATGTIPVGGTVTLPFANLTPGPIAVPETTTIYGAIPGWDTATVLSGVLGSNVESRADFEARRSLSVAHNSLGSLPSIRGAVLTVANVIDAFVTENDTNAPIVVGGATLGPNSLYVAAVGGDSAAIARAIWSRKAPGCAYNGNTHVTVLDTSPGYIPPYPSYDIKFEIPDQLIVLFSVVLANSPIVPADAVTQIKNAIIGAFAGLDGGSRAKIGVEAYASRYYNPISVLGPWVQIVSIEIGSINAPDAVFTGSISGTTLTVTNVSQGTLGLGQTILDSSGNVVPGTTIVNLGTGGGGVGTYIVSSSQTIASEGMISATPNLFRIPVRIDQIPVTSAPYISVSLLSQ